MREWRTMHRERAKWEVYRSRLAVDAKNFEKAKAELDKKLKVAEDTLAEERRQWREVCKKDNDNMHRAHTEITNLKAQAQVSAKTIVDLSAPKSWQQLVSKDRDMTGKDAEIAELKRRLRESQEKVDSLEIDLEAENKAESAIESRNVSQAALDVAPDNYAKMQPIVEPIDPRALSQQLGVVAVIRDCACRKYSVEVGRA
ncbi:hypothetical protein Hanom_Chr07g00581601 [Helianthus anomalus]